MALYAILRWKVVVDATLGTGYTNNLLIGLGLLSLVIASFSMVLSTNYKRLLAYSSIEHTGLTCLGLALGPLGIFAALLHLVNHTAAKSMLFLLTGRILHRYNSPRSPNVTGLLKAMPLTGGLFAVGILAIIGLPPFGIFVSEFALIRAGFARGQPWLMGAVLALLAVGFRLAHQPSQPDAVRRSRRRTVSPGETWQLADGACCLLSVAGLVDAWA